jgi:hypothetical protein
MVELAYDGPVRHVHVNGVDLEPLTCERLGAITAPTPAVGAEYGMPYTRRIVERVAECITSSRSVDLSSVTHLMRYQAPELFNPLVLDFPAEH